jgi:glycosyltransferase involved in cell wall biosynthesis
VPSGGIHQLLPSFSIGDAIGHHVIAIRRVLREWGRASTVYADFVHESLASMARPTSDLLSGATAGDTVLFHFSLGKDAVQAYTAFPGRRILVYHNVTPAEYFEGVNSRIARQCREGRETLGELAAWTDLALGVSEFNRRELEAAGFRKTGTLPIPVDAGSLGGRADASVLRRFGGGKANLFHVGRLAPNKKIEDLLKVFYFYRKVRPESRLIIAGTDCDTESYALALRELAEALHLQDVFFLGRVSGAELNACYRLASAYVSMSEHEGFCVPLVEAMASGVPVVAFAAGGVPETVADGGLLIAEKKYPEIALLIDRVVADRGFNRELIDIGRRRAAAFSMDSFRKKLAELLREESEMSAGGGTGRA